MQQRAESREQRAESRAARFQLIHGSCRAAVPHTAIFILLCWGAASFSCAGELHHSSKHLLQLCRLCLYYRMSRDIKPIVYHYCRRGWHEQLLSVCDTILSKKNKDAFALFWRAYSMGMAGNVPAAISLFEEYQAKRDMQFPSTLALAFFHRRLPAINQELLDQLHSEASVSEDVTVLPSSSLSYAIVILTTRKSQDLSLLLDSPYLPETLIRRRGYLRRCCKHVRQIMSHRPHLWSSRQWPSNTGLW